MVATVKCNEYCNKYCLLLIYVIPLLLLAVAAFGGTIALCVLGIVRATESNPCVTNNNGSIQCTLFQTIGPAINDPTANDSNANTEDSFDPNEYLLWMAGATGCGVLFAVICTLALWALEDTAYRINKQNRLKKRDLDNIEMTDSTNAPVRPPPPQPKVIGKIGKYHLVEKEAGDIRQIGPCWPGSPLALLALFSSCLFAILSLLCLLWAIAIGVNHSRRVETTVWHFIIVEALVALGFPFLLFISGVFMASVLDFITFGAVDARRGLQYFLKSVKFETGTELERESVGGDPNKKEYDFWIIVDTFYFYLDKRKREDREKKGFCFSCYPNPATWVLVVILYLCINLATSYFVDITLDMQVSVTSCEDPRIDRTFSCFNSTTLAYVDCITDVDVELIHCFKLYRFGVDVDLIQSIATTYVFFLVATSIFAHLFMLMKVSLHISNKRVWGGIVVVVGFILLIISGIVIVIWFTGSVIRELSRLNIINLFQLVMVSLFVILIGVLMLKGKWAEKKKVKGKNAPVTSSSSDQKAAEEETKAGDDQKAETKAGDNQKAETKAGDDQKAAEGETKAGDDSKKGTKKTAKVYPKL